MLMASRYSYSCDVAMSLFFKAGLQLDLCNCKEAAGMLYGTHEAVLLHGTQLGLGWHGKRSCRCAGFSIVLFVLLDEGLHLQRLCRSPSAESTGGTFATSLDFCRRPPVRPVAWVLLVQCT